MLYTIDQQQIIAERLREAGREVEFHAFPSVQGHDSFLVDLPRFEPALRGFFQGIGIGGR